MGCLLNFKVEVVSIGIGLVSDLLTDEGDSRSSSLSIRDPVVWSTDGRSSSNEGMQYMVLSAKFIGKFLSNYTCYI